MLGPDGKHYRASDDGEPSNLSGPPVLGQIRSLGLSDIMGVRYLGGTQLGVPGLINAYKTAAKDALDNANIVKKTVEKQIDIFFEYDLTNVVMRFVKEQNVTLVEQDFMESCRVRISTRISQYDQIVEKHKAIHQLTIAAPDNE